MAGLLTAIVVGGCGDGVGGNGSLDGGVVFEGGVVRGDPFDASVRASALATAVCAYRAQCEPIFATYLPESQQQCETRVTADYLSLWKAIEPLVQEGRAAFSVAGFERCLGAYATARQDCALGPDPLACADLFHGGRPAGIGCGADSECVTGTWCRGPSTGACGTCVTFAKSQESCQDNACAPGLSCIEIGQSAKPTCIPITVEIGQPCGTPATGLCRGRLQCVGPASGPFTCARPAARGAACDGAGVMPDCNIYLGDVCVGARCVPINVGAPGTACGMARPDVLCNADSRCDVGGMCVALGAAGATCNDTFACGKGLYCKRATPGAVNGTCAATGAVNSSCTRDLECASGTYCIGGTCAPLRFAACAP